MPECWLDDTVDGSEIWHQLRLVVGSSHYLPWVLAPSKRWKTLAGCRTVAINRMAEDFWPTLGFLLGATTGYGC